MRRGLVLIPIVAALTLSLSGCATAADAAAWNAKRAAAASAAAAQANLELRPWTSVVLAQSKELARSVQFLQSAGCRPHGAPAGTCRVGYVRQARLLEAVRTNLGDAVDPSSPSFRGSAPAVISAQYTSTREAVFAAAEVGRKVRKLCRSDASLSKRARCRTSAGKLQTSVERLDHDLAEWERFR